jgi:glycerophosphoryl diester phosphodiesterase
MRHLIGIGAVLAATSALLVPSPVAAQSPDPPTRVCRAIAHRMGATSGIDENTLEGLRRTTRMGVRAEVDFAPTTDGLVAFHPNMWEQGTDGQGYVWDTTQEYAAGLTTLPNGQHVPSAAEVLDQAAAGGSRLLIELHHWVHWQPEFLAHLVRRIDHLDLWDRVWITGTRGALTALSELVDATVLWRVDGESNLTLEAAQKLGIDLMAVSRGAPVSLIRSWRDAGYPVTARQSKIRAYAWAMRHRILTVQTNTPGSWLRYCDGSAR